MTSQSATRSPLPAAPPPLIAQIGASLLGGLAVLLGGALLFAMVFGALNLGRVYPNVSVAGVDLSGVRRTEAATLLASQLDFPQTGQITLSYGERTWTLSPAQLGLRLDAEASANAAYGFGRSLWPWVSVAEKAEVLRGGADLAPRLVFDGDIANATLLQLAQELNQPTIEAVLSITGLDVQVSPGQVGLTLDIASTSNLLASQLLRMEDTEVPLVVVEQPPRILDVSAQADIARNTLSQELRIVPGGDYEGNPEGWSFSPEELAAMLKIERVDYEDGARYQIGLDTQKLGAFVAALAPDVAEIPGNARFIFNDETRQLDLMQAATIGRRLEIEASVEYINQQLAEGVHTIELQYDYSNPEVTSEATAADLGITELVEEQTTYFYGSSAARMQNIATAASRFHGLLVAPGEIFSMVDNIGDISLDSGFAEALIIYGDRTIKGVGGGVCQVSTTLFRTVFFGGFPVVERSPHAYRVYYYELNASNSVDARYAGLDATVYAPVVDFKFQNDTPYWLLMETYVNIPARTITWKFYSTDDWRSVEWDSTGLQNIVEAPDTVYEENSDLAQGEVKQVDYEADGADVTVYRTVTRDGQVLYDDVFRTQYRPWAAIYQYGPGTPNMPPEDNDND
jgi:vancomycin resistance protein YoaR